MVGISLPTAVVKGEARGYSEWSPIEATRPVKNKKKREKEKKKNCGRQHVLLLEWKFRQDMQEEKNFGRISAKHCQDEE